jgi:hypothetical protein
MSGIGIAIAVGGAPDEQLAQASVVEVREKAGEPTTYRIRYSVDVRDGDLPWLIDERFDPDCELSVLVPVEEETHCLVKGPVHGHSVHLQHGGSGSWLEVLGSDTSVAMDRATKSAVWPNVTDSDVASSILLSYGYVPDVESTSASHADTKHSLVQRDSDLRFIRRLARRNGYSFWVTADSNGIETAHFKRPPVDEEPEEELVINLETPSISELDITWDVERPTSIKGSQLDLNSKANIGGDVGGSPLTALGSDRLADIAPGDRSLHLAAPADDAGDLQARGEGTLIEAEWFIKATCRTTLGAVAVPLRLHMLVNVRGAGTRHSGTYMVSGVTHTISATGHRMELELIRNAWGGQDGSGIV